MLALVFQDEAQPAYHLPNFNRKPEDHYIDDLKVLQKELNGYGGLYRGIMFQVDRGKTFAKSFKEFVGNAYEMIPFRFRTKPKTLLLAGEWR